MIGQIMIPIHKLGSYDKQVLFLNKQVVYLNS